MRKVFKTIYYLYDRFVYIGVVGGIHPKGYSKEHAFTVFVFLQLINIFTLIDFLRLTWVWDLPILVNFLYAILLYFINRYFFFNEELKEKPSILMIIIVIIYIIGSFALMLLSFRNIVPR